MAKSYIDLKATSGLADFFHRLNISVLISTYQAGKVIAIGCEDGTNLSHSPFSFKKPMGIALQDSKMAIATLDEIQFLASTGDKKDNSENPKDNYDKCYLHRAAFNTSRLDVHDIEFGKGALWGINTAFSCLCKFDVKYSFVPKWKPDFITSMVPEDRCHLNGLAMLDDMPKYVTALGQSDKKEGWRSDIMGGGILMEVPSGRIILDKLAMPHSPRLINDELYLLESGNGNLIRVNTETGEKELIFAFNRFVRGLAHYENILFVGCSKIRESSKIFNGLDVKQNSEYAGLIVFDLKNRVIIGMIDYKNVIEEIFDVQVLTKTSKPIIINQTNERIKDIITTSFGNFTKKPDSKKKKD